MVFSLLRTSGSLPARAAKSARKITSANVPTEEKHWVNLVRMYNGPGQVPYYVGKLKQAWSYYEGKCPSADSYNAKLSSDLSVNKEIKVADFGNTGRGIFDHVHRLLRAGSPFLMGNRPFFAPENSGEA